MRMLTIIMNRMDLPHNFSLKGRLLVLRFSHLGRVPPAQYETELLAESGIGVVIVEFGSVKGGRYIDAPLCKLRFPTQSGKVFPRKLRSAVAFLESASEVFSLVLKYSKPRLVVAHGLKEQCIAYLLRLFFKIPYVVHCHESMEPQELTPFNRLLLSLEGRILRKAEFTIFPESTRAEIYRERYKLVHPSHIVFNCARKHPTPTPCDLRALLQLPAEAFLLGYLGGIGEVNALELAIEALVENPTVYFLLWGWGDGAYVASLKSRAKELGVGERVLFLGELDEKKWDMLSALDASYCVYLQTVLRLKFAATASNKLFESMAVGTPVIVGNGQDFAHFLNEVPVGYALPELSANALVTVLKRCVGSPEELKEKGRLARELHESVYHYEAQFQKVLPQFSRFFPPSATRLSLEISMG